jgi:hypothetical protein
MANFHVPYFEGVLPKKSDQLLKDTEATVSENARLEQGFLTSWKAPLASATLSANPKTIFRYNNQWLKWASKVDTVRTPVTADEYERIFYTGDGDPKYTYIGRPTGDDANGFQLGVPSPTAIVTATSSNASGTFEEDRYYVYTYVTPLGEEGPPSSPSTKITVADNASVAISFATETLGDYNLGSGSHRRLYRTGTGTTSTEYQFVADIAIGTTTYSDTILLENLGEVIPSLTWDPPPHANTVGLGPLEGLITVVNGYLAGFVGNTLCFSEQYMPSAWPSPYRMSFDSDIVGLGVAGNSIVVLTETYPYLVSGSEPADMSAVRVESAQACVSKDSIIDGGEYLIYASPDGLMGVSEAGVENLTEEVLTREQWQAYSPDSLVGLYYEDHYIGISSSKSFIIDREGALSELVNTAVTPNVPFNWVNGYSDLKNDQLYVLGTTGQVELFNEGAALTTKWTSKSFMSSRPTSIGVVEVDLNGTADFTLLGESGATVATHLFTGNRIETIRIPSHLSREWKFSVKGTGKVLNVTLASTVMELVRG